MFVGGWHSFVAALEHGYLQQIFIDESKQTLVLEYITKQTSKKTVRQQVLSTKKFKERFGQEAHQGIISQINLPELVTADTLVETALTKKAPIILLEDIQDPQNLGSIFRAAHALGAVGIVTTKHRSAPRSAATIRASAGSFFAVPMAEIGGVPNWLLQINNDIMTLGTVVTNGDMPWDHQLNPSVLVFGTEADGLKPLTQNRVHAKITIPMPTQTLSLNLAQTVTACLYEAFRQRHQHK